MVKNSKQVRKPKGSEYKKCKWILRQAKERGEEQESPEEEEAIAKCKKLMKQRKAEKKHEKSVE